jgi:hypothetical protein
VIVQLNMTIYLKRVSFVFLGMFLLFVIFSPSSRCRAGPLPADLVAALDEAAAK